MNDTSPEFETRLSAALHELTPSGAEIELLAETGDHRRAITSERTITVASHPRAIRHPLVLVASVAILIAGTSFAASSLWRSGQGNATHGVPAWVRHCLPTTMVTPAPEYVGLTVEQANHLAGRQHAYLQVYGAGGHCERADLEVGVSNKIGLVYKSIRVHNGVPVIPKWSVVLAADHIYGNGR